MNREALVITRTAFVVLRSSYATPELFEAVEKLTELGLDPLNTRVQQQADALIRVRDEIRKLNILKDAPRQGGPSPANGKSEAASPTGHGTQGEPAAGRSTFLRPRETPGGTTLSLIEGGLLGA